VPTTAPRFRPISSTLSADFQLEQSDLAEVERILAEEIPDPVGPQFMAPPEHVGV